MVFEKEGDGVRVTADVGGFEPNTKHGFHIHKFGDLGSPDASSAGEHFNPNGHDHALPDAEVRHEGDMGNLVADENGHAKLSLLIDKIALGAGKQGILGRAVIIHAGEDDGSQPSGDAGDRIAAGIIGISKDALPKPDSWKKPKSMKKDKSMNADPEKTEMDHAPEMLENEAPAEESAPNVDAAEE